MKIVLDTASFISGLRSSRGASAEIIRLALLQRVVLLMDYKLAAEYRDVALRAEHLDHSGRSAEEVLRLISILEAVAEPVLVVFKPRPLSIDPDDDMILDLAINGHADSIVSQNIKHLKEPAWRYGIDVLRPAEFLTELRAKG